MLTLPSLHRSRSAPSDEAAGHEDNDAVTVVSAGWFSRAFSVAQLGSHFGRTLSASAACAVASVWLVATVLALATLLTMAAGWIGGTPLLSHESFVDTVRLLHLMPVATRSGDISLLPMVPALAVLALMLHASRWLAERLPGSDRQAATLGWFAGLAGGYLITFTLIATSPTPEAAEEPLLTGWASLATMVLLGVGSVASRVILPVRTPLLWNLLRAAATALAMLLAISLLVLLARLAFRWPELWALGQELLASGVEPASRFDAAALGAIQLGYLPNAVVWTLAYLLGAGFPIGDGTIITPFTVTSGPLPQLPLTALIPGAPLPVPWLAPLVMGASTMLAGSVVRHSGLVDRLPRRLFAGVSLALLVMLGCGVLATAASGGLGPGRMEAVGPTTGGTMLAALVVVGLAQLLWALLPSLLADIGPFAEQLRELASGLGGKFRRPRARRGAPSMEE